MAIPFPSPDRPITSLDEDALGRGPFARLLAAEALSAPPDAGFVIGVTGPWGAGKTSALHLIEREIADRAAVLWFNPWLFAGAEQLVALFFAEIAGQLKGRGRRLKKLGRSLAAYGEVIAPAAGMVLGPLAQALAVPNRLDAMRNSSVRERREELKSELMRLGAKLVVFVDDFDRLTPGEVREVIRLAKLVADLPNVVYVLAYDQSRVERALGDDAESGRAYLDKIVQAPHALPAISTERLRGTALNYLQGAVGGRELHYFDQDQWSIIASSVLRFITTLREAKRYANVVPSALDLVGEEVAAHDVLGLTALRVFEPDVHASLPRIRVELTGESEEIDLRDRSEIRAEHQAHISEVLDLATNRPVTSALVQTLFPAAPLGSALHTGSDRQSRALHRVSSGSVLRAYLHTALDPGQIASADLDRIIGVLDNREALRRRLDCLQDEQLPDFLDRLRDHPDQFPDAAPENAAAEILRIEPRVPASEGMASVRPSHAIEWVLQDLIAQLPNDAAQTRAIRALFDLAESPSQRSRVLSAFGTWPEHDRRRPDDQPALDESITAELEQRLVANIMRAAPSQLASEPGLRDLLSVLYQHDEDNAREFLNRAAADDRFFLAAAAACIRRIRSSSPPFRRAEMQLDVLSDLLGGSKFVVRRAQEIRARGGDLSAAEGEALALLPAADDGCAESAELR